MPDPRISDRTVNEILQSLAIRHGVSIERFKGSEVKRLLDILAEADAAALEKLEARLKRLGHVELQRFGFGLVTTERLMKVREAIDELADKALEILYGNLAETMFKAAKAEVEFQAGAIAATVTVATDWISPSNSVLRALVRARPFTGKFLREIAREWSEGKKSRVTAAIRTAIINGQTVDEATQSVRDVLDNSRIGAERITRTAIAHVTNAARAETYIANSDVLKGVKWVATLDSRTCAECGALDGRVFPVKTARRPPAHLSCRCVMVPVTRFDIGVPVSSRASSNGQVPGNLTFAEWLKTQSADVQEDVLGKSGARLFRKGGVNLDGFVDKSGRPFTLEELRRRNADAFRRAGID